MGNKKLVSVLFRAFRESPNDRVRAGNLVVEAYQRAGEDTANIKDDLLRLVDNEKEFGELMSKVNTIHSRKGIPTREDSVRRSLIGLGFRVS